MRKRYVYLSGAIDLAPDLGIEWRARVSGLLRQAELEPYDPTVEQKSVCGLDPSEMKELERDNPPEFVSLTRIVMKADLEVVGNQSVAVVCSLDEHARMGTYAELGIASYFGVPIALIDGTHGRGITGWVRASASRIFEGIDEFANWIRELVVEGRKGPEAFCAELRNG